MRPAYTILARLVLLFCIVGTAIPGNAKERLLVFGAASARDALDAAIEAFPNHGGRRLTGVYAASSALARQILNGAPAGLFLSASAEWIDQVATAGLVRERGDLARNSLVLVAPKHARPSVAIHAAADMVTALGDARMAVAGVDAVPAGRYARQALTSLGVWDALSPRLAQTANVRAALLLVERGEAPLGLVYRTDSLVSRDVVTLWTVPDAAHDDIVYSLVLLQSAAADPVATALFRFLLSNDGKRIFAAHGFVAEPGR